MAPETRWSKEDLLKIDEKINRFDISENAERLDNAATVTEMEVVTERLIVHGLDRDHREDQFRAACHKNNGGDHPASDLHERAKTSNLMQFHHGPATLLPIRVKQEASL